MGWIKRLFIVILLLAVFSYGVFFTIENATTVPLNLIWIELDNQRVSVWLLASFCSGLLLGLLLNIWSFTKLKTRQVGLKRQVEKQSLAIADNVSK